jgi:hypothetical protein
MRFQFGDFGGIEDIALGLRRSNAQFGSMSAPAASAAPPLSAARSKISAFDCAADLASSIRTAAGPKKSIRIPSSLAVSPSPTQAGRPVFWLTGPCAP